MNAADILREIGPWLLGGAALLGQLASFIIAIRKRRNDTASAEKDEADAADKITDAAGKIVTLQKDQINLQKGQLDALTTQLKFDEMKIVEQEARLFSAEGRIQKLEFGLMILTQQLKKASLVPEWTDTR